MASSQVLMHLATVGGTRSEREIAALVTLLGSNDVATLCPAAAALWALAREPENRLAATFLGALEQLLGTCRRLLSETSAVEEEAACKAAAFAVACMWQLVQEPRCWYRTRPGVLV